MLKNAFHDPLQNVPWILGNGDLRSFISVDPLKSYSFGRLCLMVTSQNCTDT